ncbi:uncharacterized protein LOC105437649 [Strongylocentrotus purpuratus]|uniref:Sulfotransferase family protein n=1 Tax=Strongylocentrotus purpuratus TaxID=7668 RepID=A0A7M7N6G9_STRPU|nr:uncharacterized protein LOC105437649 [Strongylocentrotus purpuratus]
MSSSNTDGSRTILWCVPRSISTALAKCLSFIDASEVWFEPYAYCNATSNEYNHQTKLNIPMDYEGNEEIFQRVKKALDGMANTHFEPDRLSYGSVKRRLEATTAKHVMVKDMGNAMTEEYRAYLPKGYRHTFLIRHPVRSIASYRKMMYNQFSELGLLEGKAASEETYDVERDDRFFPSGYGTKETYDLWNYIQDENIDTNPVVIDGNDLLSKPAETLSAYCTAVGLPYSNGLLQWDASPKVLTRMKASGDNLLMDLVNFYGTAMKSSCFLPSKKMPPRDQLPADVIRCSDKVMTYYEDMYKTRLKI